MDTAGDAEHGAALPLSSAADTELAELRSALESAGDLPLDDRLALLRSAESVVARALEALDGL